MMKRAIHTLGLLWILLTASISAVGQIGSPMMGSNSSSTAGGPGSFSTVTVSSLTTPQIPYAGVAGLLTNSELYRTSSSVIELKNAATAMAFRVYGTTTGPKYLTVSHDGTNGVIDTAASSGLLSIAPTNATNVTFGKAILVPDATPNPPSIAFSAASTTGIYRNAGGGIGFSFAGTPYVQISSAQLTPASLAGTDLGTTSLSWKRIYVDYTNTGTIGAVTINKALGRVNVAAAAATVTVTDSYATAASAIFATAAANDATCSVKNVVPAAGSFVINMNANCTANTAVSFFIHNTD